MKNDKLQRTELNKNDKRPIAKFYRCRLEDLANGVTEEKRRGINREQFRAADRLACSYRRAFISSGSGGGFIKIQKIKHGCPRDYQPETKLQAVRDYLNISSKLSRKSHEIIEHFCLLELPLRQYELKQRPQWAKGVGSARLREALDDLIEVYKTLN